MNIDPDEYVKLVHLEYFKLYLKHVQALLDKLEGDISPDNLELWKLLKAEGKIDLSDIPELDFDKLGPPIQEKFWRSK